MQAKEFCTREKYWCETGHCCGNGQCCNYYYELWWFWVIWIIVLLIGGCCAWQRRRVRKLMRQQKPPSRRNPNRDSELATADRRLVFQWSSSMETTILCRHRQHRHVRHTPTTLRTAE
ncbi:WW domain binding protein 1-like isoform X2 [Ptychodera flava]|uniref:WW domain binding protein 1-like isoform X2 n=1 Tax=Ptychodera flava TaxID=63121 RepID=UPI00396A8A46